jgi:hypothetical protein
MLKMSMVVNGQDDTTLNQAMLEHSNPSKKLNLRIECPRELFYTDLESISRLLVHKNVNILRLERSKQPCPHTLNIIFIRPSLKQGYRGDREPTKAICSFVGQIQQWELGEGG